MTLTKKLVIGASLAGAMLLHSRRRRAALANGLPVNLDDPGSAGLSEVDPQPISQIVEAMDPDATRDAHEEIREQRERLPGRDKNPI